MEDILVTKENGLFYADVTDEFKEERLIICARTKEDFIDLIAKEIDFRCCRKMDCLENGDQPGCSNNEKWIEAMCDIAIIADFM